MKSALPQQAPTPIKMKSVTLLNKREKPYILASTVCTSGCYSLSLLARWLRFQ